MIWALFDQKKLTGRAQHERLDIAIIMLGLRRRFVSVVAATQPLGDRTSEARRVALGK